MAAPTLQQVTYTDPSQPYSPGTPQWGVFVSASAPPTGQCLALCLMCVGQPSLYGIGVQDTGNALIPITSPLGNGLPYTICAQWAPTGTNPSTLNWRNPSVVATAPVVTQRLRITAGSVALNGTTATVNLLWESGAGALLAGAWSQVMTANGQAIGFSTASTSFSATISNLTLTPSTSYWLYAYGLQPVTTGSFASPYSQGPASAACLLPTTSPTLTSIAYDGAELIVAWQPAAQLPAGISSREAAYWLQITNTSGLTGTFPATSTGARIATTLTPDATIAGAISLGPITGPSATAQQVLATAPGIAGVRLTPDPNTAGNTLVSVRLTPAAGQPSWAAIQAVLIQNGVPGTPAIATGSPPQAVFSAPLTASGSYAVQARLVSSGTTVAVTGPACAPVAFSAGTPALTGFSYDGAQLTINWSPAAGPAITGYQVTLTGAISGTYATGLGPSLTLPASLAPAAQLTAVVTPTGPIFLGLTSSSSGFTVPPLAPAPIITECAFDGVNLRLNWTPSGGPGLDAYAVKVWGAADPGSSTPPPQQLTFFTTLRPGLEVSLPCDVPRTWGANVTPLAGSNNGAASTNATIVTAVASVTGLTIASGVLSGNWIIEGATQALLTQLTTAANNAVVQTLLLDGDQMLATASTAIAAGTGQLTITLPSGINTSRLSLVTQITMGVAAGPRSGPVAVLATAPTVASAVYDGQWLTLSWTGAAQDGVLGYTITLTPSTGTALTFTTGPETILQVSANLDLTKTWTATVQPFGANTTGVASAAATVALPTLAAPALSNVSYDGEFLTLEWNPPALPYLTGYQVALTGTTTATFSTGPETSLVLPLTPAQAAGTSVAVTGVSALRNSPASAAVALLTAAPTISAVTLTSTDAAVVWNVTLPTGASAFAELLDGDTVVSTVAATATGASVPLTSVTPGTRYAVRGYLTSTPARGPRSGPVAILATAPTVASASYDGQWLTLSWTGAAQDGVLGYTITLTPSTGTALTFTTGPETILQVSANLDLTKTWTATVQPFGANTTGVASTSATVTLPPLAAPALTNISYDGELLTLEWNQAQLPYLTGYQVALTGGSAPGTFSTGPETKLALPLTPAQAASTSVAVTGVSALRNSPASAAVAVVTVTPTISAVSVSATDAIVAWNVTLPTGASAFAELLDGDTVLSAVAATATGASVPLTSVTPGARYAVRGYLTSAAARGPRSGPVAVLATAPTIASAVYDGQWLTLSWTGAAQDGVLGYTVTLTPSGGGTALTFTTGPETILQVSANLDLSKTWTATARPFGANTTGVASASATVALPPLAAPALTSVSYDGELLTLEWNPPALPYLTGYQVALTGTTAATFSTGPETSLVLPLTPAQAAGTSVAVTGVSALRNSPASAAVALVTLTPTISSVSVSATDAVVTWNVTLPTGASAFAELLDGDTVVSTVAATATGASVLLTSVTPGTRYAVRGYLTSTPARGPRSGPVAVLATAPTVASAVYDGQWLTLSWTGAAQDGVLGYTVTLTPSSGTALTFTTGPETILQVSANLDLTKTWTATVQPFGANTTGPASATATVLQPPVFTAVGYTNANVLQASWTPAPSATGYNVVFTQGLSSVHTTQTTSASLPATGFTLPAGFYEMRVQAVMSASLTTPWSAPAPVFNLAVAALTASYDGRTARFSWPAVAADCVVGYQVTVLNGTTAVAPTPLTTTATSLAVPIAFAGATAYTATVQALTTAGAGAPLSAAVSLFQPGLYLSTDPTKAPYLAPAADPSLAAQAIVINLPEIFPAHVTTGLPATPPFVMSATSVPAPFAYTLTLPANSAVWTFDATTVRAPVQTAWQTFLTSLIGLNITPLGWQTVQDALARVMPQTFAETLLYGYGFNPAQGYADLRPGMILRAEYEAYQYIGPGQPGSAYIDGYVGTCTAEYEVSSYVDSTARWLTGIDAFLAQITGPGGSSVPTPTTSGNNTMPGGGAADFFFSQFRQPFCRIVFPTSFPAQNSAGSPQPWLNVAVLAAADYGSLQAATAQLRNGLAPTGAAVLYLRGRTTLSACIRVWLNGAPLVVPLGATVGNLLEQRGARPPLMGSLPLNGLSVARTVGASITDASAGTNGCAVGATRAIRLDWLTAPAYGLLTDRLSLPLFHGDQITIATGGS